MRSPRLRLRRATRRAAALVRPGGRAVVGEQPTAPIAAASPLDPAALHQRRMIGRPRALRLPLPHLNDTRFHLASANLD